MPTKKTLYLRSNYLQLLKPPMPTWQLSAPTDLTQQSTTARYKMFLLYCKYCIVNRQHILLLKIKHIRLVLPKEDVCNIKRVVAHFGRMDCGFV